MTILRNITETVYCCDHFAIIEVPINLTANLYFPAPVPINDCYMQLHDISIEIQFRLDRYIKTDLITDGEFQRRS
jgi:hypothetical protein